MLEANHIKRTGDTELPAAVSGNRPLSTFDFQLATLIATDLDGTLLRSDHTLSERTLAAIRKTLAEGRHILLVSGRPPRFVRPLLAQYQLDLPFANYNGAAIFPDADASEPIYRQPLDTTTALAIIAALRQYAPELNLQMEAGEQMYADRIDTAMAERMLMDTAIVPPSKLGPIERQIEEDGLIAMKLLTFVGRERMSAAIAHINSLGHGVYATTSGRGLLEIMAAGVDKAKAAEWWAARLGIAAETVIAFGDELNDIPLLKWAGLGVAVANAQPDTLDVADYVTASNDDEGVALVLERLNASR